MPKFKKEKPTTEVRKFSCSACGLYTDSTTSRMKPWGLGKKDILIIGEAPGEIEDRRGLHWQGRAGKLLTKELAAVGIDLYEDCISVNAVNCRPPGNRTPTMFEMDCCKKVIVDKVFLKHQPKTIVLLGQSALQSFMSARWMKDLGSIDKWRGFVIPDQDYKAHVLPTLHPSYLLKMDTKELHTIWKDDLKKLAGIVDKPCPIFQEPEIEILEDLSELEKFEFTPNIAFDYETTGLKPQAFGHRIVCASVAADPDKAYAFMMPSKRSERAPFVNLLTSMRIGKMAHNMKFEEAWTKYRLKVQINNWDWDSMIAAHTLDNRRGITGLKFQTYVNFGVIDYASEITPYLQGVEKKNGNSMNRVLELIEEPGGKEKLLKYCALDSHYQYKLAMIQKYILNGELPF